jgi:hypothetical protein
VSRFLFMGEQEDPAFDELKARGITRIYDGTAPDRCPLCESPKPELHPSLGGGDVETCAHPWHASTEEGRVRLAKLRPAMALTDDEMAKVTS